MKKKEKPATITFVAIKKTTMSSSFKERAVIIRISVPHIAKKEKVSAAMILQGAVSCDDIARQMGSSQGTNEGARVMISTRPLNDRMLLFLAARCCNTQSDCGASWRGHY